MCGGGGGGGGGASEAHVYGDVSLIRVCSSTFDSDSGYAFWARILIKLQDRVNFKQTSKISPNTPLQGAKYSKLECQNPEFYKHFAPNKGQDFEAPVAGPVIIDMSLLPSGVHFLSVRRISYVVLLLCHCRTDPNTFYCLSSEYNILDLVRHGSNTEVARCIKLG